MNKVEIHDKIQEIRSVFGRDELYLKIQRDFDLDELLNPEDEFYEKLTFDEYYKTKEAAAMLGIADKSQQILNHLNNPNLADYIKATQSTDRRYRLTWQPLFRLKMLFYLFDKNFKPNDVAILLGATAMYVPPTNEAPKSSVNHSSNIDLDKFKDDLVEFEKHQQQEMMKMFNAINERNQVLLEQAKAESKMELIIQQLDDLSNVEKQYEILLNILEESEKAEPIKLKSIFKWMQISDEKTDYNKQKIDINSQLNQIKTKREELQSNLKDVKEKITLCTNKMDRIGNTN
ncbi:conserved hypothetical protein (plasmid) [Lysinibacillus sphaericus C3-41]|uniref:Uncharacterized protein n=1 Tax=Lysinibacillus sphaericus (strain C3-41) TaxID=444177 RepID=B1I0Q6_LYSSC|nr:conserved hypothetical protein [Lysinibacillus sphaericus C3-41]